MVQPGLPRALGVGSRRRETSNGVSLVVTACVLLAMCLVTDVGASKLHLEASTLLSDGRSLTAVAATATADEFVGGTSSGHLIQFKKRDNGDVEILRELTTSLGSISDICTSSTSIFVALSTKNSKLGTFQVGNGVLEELVVVSQGGKDSSRETIDGLTDASQVVCTNAGTFAYTISPTLDAVAAFSVSTSSGDISFLAVYEYTRHHSGGTAALALTEASDTPILHAVSSARHSLFAYTLSNDGLLEKTDTCRKTTHACALPAGSLESVTDMVINDAGDTMFAADGQQVVKISLNGGSMSEVYKATTVLDIGEGTVDRLALSHDGLFVYGWTDSQLSVYKSSDFIVPVMSVPAVEPAVAFSLDHSYVLAGGVSSTTASDSDTGSSVSSLAIVGAHVTSLSVSDGPLDGGTEIVIQGSGFSEVLGHNSVTINGNTCIPTHVSYNGEEITCKTGKSTRSGAYTVKVTVQEIDGESWCDGESAAACQFTYLYEDPSIASVSFGSECHVQSSCGGAHTHGGEFVTLIGSNFGHTEDASVTVTYGTWEHNFADFTCEVEYFSSNQVVCTTSAGSGRDLGFKLTRHAFHTVSNDPSSDGVTLSYAGPHIDSWKCFESGAPCGIALDGEKIVISGSEFPESGVRVTVGREGMEGGLEAAECSDPQVNAAGTEISCSVPAGAGADFHVQVHDSESGQTTPKDNDIVFSYASPTVTSVNADGAVCEDEGKKCVGFPTTGATSLTVEGENFDDRSTSSVAVAFRVSGGDPISACTIDTVSQTKITCTLLPGSGEDLVIAVANDNEFEPQWSSTQPIVMVAHVAPEISSLSFGSCQEQQLCTGFHTDGEELVTIHGHNFDQRHEALKVTYGHFDQSTTGLSGRIRECAIVGVDENQIRCTTEPGSGKHLKFQVTNLGILSENSGDQVSPHAQSSTVAEDSPEMSYAGPHISEIVCADTLKACVIPVGGAEVIVRGHDFEIPSQFTGDHGVKVTFGQKDFAEGYDSFTCELISVNDAGTQIRCQMPPGAGANLRMKVTDLSANQVSDVTEAGAEFSYAAPIVTSVEAEESGECPSDLVCSGFGPLDKSMITVMGSQFDSRGVDRVRVRYGIVASSGTSDYSCSVQSVTESSIVCSLSEGSGSGLKIRVSNLGPTAQWSDVDEGTAEVSYSAPVITSVSAGKRGCVKEKLCSGLDPAGGETVTLHGSNFIPSKVRVTYSDKLSSGDQVTTLECPVLNSTANTISCQTSPGKGFGHDLVFQVTNMAAVQQSSAMSADGPRVTYKRDKVMLNFTVAGTVEDFNKTQFIETLAASTSVDTEHLSVVSVTQGSVLVEVQVLGSKQTTASKAAITVERLVQSEDESLSSLSILSLQVDDQVFTSQCSHVFPVGAECGTELSTHGTCQWGSVCSHGRCRALSSGIAGYSCPREDEFRSRHLEQEGLYCQDGIVHEMRSVGEICLDDRECQSMACGADGFCAKREEDSFCDLSVQHRLNPCGDDRFICVRNETVSTSTAGRCVSANPENDKCSTTSECLPGFICGKTSPSQQSHTCIASLSLPDGSYCEMAASSVERFHLASICQWGSVCHRSNCTALEEDGVCEGDDDCLPGQYCACLHHDGQKVCKNTLPGSECRNEASDFASCHREHHCSDRSVLTVRDSTWSKYNCPAEREALRCCLTGSTADDTSRLNTIDQETTYKCLRRVTTEEDAGSFLDNGGDNPATPYIVFVFGGLVAVALGFLVFRLYSNNSADYGQKKRRQLVVKQKQQKIFINILNKYVLHWKEKKMIRQFAKWRAYSVAPSRARLAANMSTGRSRTATLKAFERQVQIHYVTTFWEVWKRFSKQETAREEVRQNSQRSYEQSQQQRATPAVPKLKLGLGGTPGAAPVANGGTPMKTPPQSQSQPVTSPDIAKNLSQLDKIEASAENAKQLDQLAQLYYKQGHMRKAEPLFLRSLEMREGVLSDSDPALVAGIENLAALYKAQGQFDKAEKLYLKALEAEERRVGTHGMEVCNVIENLVTLFYTQGRLPQAEPFLMRILEIKEKHLGKNHEDIATCARNLGLLYKSLNKMEEAEPYYVRALDIMEHRFGTDHPDVVKEWAQLASFYETKGKGCETAGDFKEAEDCYKQTLQIRDSKLGSHHRHVSDALLNLVGLYKKTERYKEAEALYIRLLKLREAKLGSDHPYVAEGLNELVGLLQLQGRLAEAEQLLLRVLDIKEQRLGPNHPGVVRAINNLAGLFESQGKWNEAEPLYARAVDMVESSMGPDHPNVAKALNSLASVYYAQGQFAAAEPLYRRCLRIHEKSSGPNNSEVLHALNNLAGLYHTQARHTEAHPLYRKALEIKEGMYGTNHPELVREINNLAALYYAMGKPQDAAMMQERAAKLRTQTPV